jgi:tetratricopeptide (TPR) repeat protein
MTEKSAQIAALLEETNQSLQRGDLNNSRDLLIQICQLDENNAAAWNHLAIINDELGLIDDAVKALLRVINLEPRYTTARVNLGILYRREGQYEDAATSLKKALAVEPDNAVALNELAINYRKLGLLDKAEQVLLHALKINPKNINALYNSGLVQWQKKNMSFATRYFSKLVELDPRNSKAWVALGKIETNLGNFDHAAFCYEKVIDINPDNVELKLSYAKCLVKDDQDPNSIENNIKTACSIYNEVCASEPDNEDALLGIASIHEKKGHYKESLSTISRVLDLNMTNVKALGAYARLCEHEDHCEKVISLLKTALRTKSYNKSDQMTLLYSLGDLYDQLADYGNAFNAYLKANELLPAPSHELYRHKVDQCISVYNSIDIHKFRRSDVESELPIFIVGMPRAGKTTTEKILSQHPGVFAANELGDIVRMMSRLAEEGINYPKGMLNLTSDRLTQLAMTYVERIRSFSPDAIRVTNTSPSSMLRLGLINQLFPNTRVIHCVRDPVDTCLSCYFQKLGIFVFGKDLEFIAHYYNNYQRLMEHWKNTLDIPILNVHFEDMFNLRQNKIIELFDFCGLDWDDNFIDSLCENSISHASIRGNRDPVPQRSPVDRWKNYREFIGPLLETLELENREKYDQH